MAIYNAKAHVVTLEMTGGRKETVLIPRLEVNQDYNQTIKSVIDNITFTGAETYQTLKAEHIRVNNVQIQAIKPEYKILYGTFDDSTGLFSY